MSPSEMKRLTLYEKLIDVLGEEPAMSASPGPRYWVQ